MSLEVKIIKLEDKKEWNLALKDLSYSIFHSWEYCNALSYSQEKEISLLRIDFNDSGAISVFSKRSKDGTAQDIYTPYGFGGIIFWGTESDSVELTMLDWFKSQNVATAYLMSHPLFGGKPSDLFECNRTSFLLDLRLSEDQLWSSMAKGHKYELKKVYKDLSIAINSDKGLIISKLPKLYADTLDRVGAGENYHFKEQTLLELIDLDSTIALAGTINGEVHAVVILLSNKNCAEYFINATDDKGRNLTRLLLWEGIKSLKAKGILKFNLGGGASEGDHLEAFKRRFGGEKSLIPVYKKIVDRQTYLDLCDRICKGPIDSDYFPAYWKKS
ncbi:GNAT family N-acetyltransferase [Hyphobacterium sp. CCMP332]|nr:GNAT family N-acetyltransferase [Hyphobacterium sp. CCMP332]